MSKKIKKIVISGAANQGKSTLVDDIIKEWPCFRKQEVRYPELAKEKGLSLNKQSNKETQKFILDTMMDELMKDHGKPTDDFKGIIFDRGPWDNLVYSLYLFENQLSDIDEKFIRECIPLVRESMKLIDATFFIPITKHHKIKIEEREGRETDPQFIQQTDFIFKSLKEVWHNQSGGIFPLQDCAPVIEVFGEREIRIQILKNYITETGDWFSEKDNLLNNIIT